MIGVPWSRPAPTKCTACPCIRWKRTQMSRLDVLHDMPEVKRRVGVGQGRRDESVRRDMRQRPLMRQGNL